MKRIDQKNIFDIPNESFWELCHEKFSGKKLFIFQTEKAAPDFLTGKMLAQKAMVLGHILQQKLASQEKVLLLLPQGLEYIYTLLACFYANVTAVPIPLTDVSNLEQAAVKIKSILKDSQAICIITDAYCQEFLKTKPDFSSISILNALDLTQIEPVASRARPQLPEDIAILLYTSGSTSQPKGVVISHRNLKIRAMASATQWDMRQDSCIVTWLPQYHSLALDLNIFSPMLKGASSVIQIPSNFIKNPQDWLVAIDRYQATHTAAPNFAFDYCCRTIDNTVLKGISLQSLQVILSGGEPIRRESFESFYQKFRGLGLRKNVFCPTYGMSEMGTVVTNKPGKAARVLSLDIPNLEQGKIKTSDNKDKTKSVISCGEIGAATEIQIVHPETGKLCSSDEVGEIWIKSSAIGIGYLNRQQETKDTFCGILSGTEKGGFLRTGDLGFIENNNLYIVGREKEVIIIHGKNYHPVDIEWTIKKNLPYLDMPIAVFSREIDQQERVIVVQELKAGRSESEYKKIASEIVSAVSSTHQIETYGIYFVKKGSIPQTGTGKIQRKACGKAYANHQLDILYRYRRQNTVTQSKGQAVASTINRGILETLKNEVLTAVLQVSAETFEAAGSFNELGLNSIQYIQIAKRIEEIFKIEFNPVLLFEYQDLTALTQYLAAQTENSRSSIIHQDGIENRILPDPRDKNEDEIAIIGISCNFPGEATDPDSFWDNLIQQKDCISPLADRACIVTDYQKYRAASDDSFPQWSGFIKDVDVFDASFFNISPLEAESMDPQQRKLLELTWKVIEDAGYRQSQLTDKNVGLFIGVHNNDYAELVSRQPALMETYGAFLDTGLHMSMVANRVSRMLNFRGPSEIINTACSSSLVAVHHAAQAIAKGECAVAIAGGVNLLLASRVYCTSYKAGMLARDGRCKSFDQAADGFVRAEGYGAVLLKSVSQAKKDGDIIYGIIKGTAINHDGQSNSLRAPNLAAQKKLIKSAYEKSKLPASSIGYIETHGTGTVLGDPIEIQALKEAFQEMGELRTEAYCGLGTVKTNIGHCESAAGIAGLIKVLLSMKHKTIPGILHFKQINPYISLNNSPFYIVDKNREWKRLQNDDGTEIPLRAGISSFGVGGANAHVIIEEYKPKEQDESSILIDSDNPALVVLSAKNEEQLYELVRQLLIRIGKQQHTDADMANIAYTLQTGREAMQKRLGVIVGSVKELIEKLQGFLERKGAVEKLYRGQVMRDRDALAAFTADEDIVQAIDAWVDKKKYGKLLDLWVKGLEFDWNRLYGNVNPRRISLPTYPFARERYWITDAEVNEESSEYKIPHLHPLVHRNTSNFAEQCFSSVFSGEEFFLKDHLIKIDGLSEQKVLPGAAYLEMARAAIEQSMAPRTESTIIELHNTVWIQPLVVTQNRQVTIALFANDGNGHLDEQIDYEIYSQDNQQEIVHCQGRAIFSRTPAPSKLDLEQLKRQMGQGRLEGPSLYPSFAKMGVHYGPSHQGILSIYQGEKQLLAQLRLPTVVEKSQNDYLLHPSLMDSALQSSIILIENLAQLPNKPSIPFALESIRIISACAKEMFAWARYSPGSKREDTVTKLDIDLCDQEGNVCVQMRGFSTRMQGSDICSAEKNHENKIGTLLAVPVWEPNTMAALSKTNQLEYTHRHVILCETSQVKANQLEALIHTSTCVQLQTRQKNIAERYSEVALVCFEQIQKIFKGKPQGKVLVQIVIADNQEEKVFTGLSGLLKTAALENPQLVGQIILTKPQITAGELAGQLKENQTRPQDAAIKYEQDIRHVLRWQEIQASKEKPKLAFKNQGVYLITGGLGGVGVLFAKEILKQARNAKIILTGRSELTEKKQALLDELPSGKGRIIYRQLDITNLDQVKRLVAAITTENKQLNGIIHCAGMILDNFILKKSSAEFRQVLAPKVAGSFNLDQATKDMDLDFLMLFSSITGAFGNLGQADYAAANGFMDHFAAYRNQLAVEKLRRGQTLSISWPLWQEGGIRPDQASREMQQQTMGMHPMQTSTGIEAFYRSLELHYSQILVMEGNLPQIRRTVLADQPVQQEFPPTAQPPMESDAGSFEEKTQDYLKKRLSTLLKLPSHKIDAQASFEKYGIDSILAMNLTNQLEKTFGSLSKTLFFEYKTIRELAEYFVKAHSAQLAALFVTAADDRQVKAIGTTSQSPAESRIRGMAVARRRFNRQSGIATDVHMRSTGAASSMNTDPIAIIGLSGRYPEAINIEAFWHNLREGKDCIIEVPRERWDWREFYSEDRSKDGYHYSKWGGFIAGVDEFDPRFFNISPREAESIDPQERLFLQHAWMAVEDAGYTRAGLQIPHEQDLAGQVGVYVGAMYGEYNPSGTLASIANRVSHVLNLHGPSMTLDTMCSSSLAAIHLACQDLKQGRTNLAIVGGVNVSIHPNKYLVLSAGQFISSDGHCQSFGEGGDGYIPGEGVGAVVLKRLSEAVRDRNHIYGIVKGSALNHGGKTHGYTVPNPQAQSSVIHRALAESNTDPRHISYIEAHGTGTKLGDPIEIAALSQAFKQHTQDTGFCLIGSAKSNIGHCESAAGIAGLTKVLLQMQHQQIAPSLHSARLNTHIDFQKTPFIVNQSLRTWDRPVIDGKEWPRTAGISSFGAGGSNAHIIVQEYVSPIEAIRSNAVIEPSTKLIIPLSARTIEQLKQKAHDLLVFIRTSQPAEQTTPSWRSIDLPAMAYTHQVGREAMEERLGFMVSTVDQLAEKLEAYINGEQNIEDAYQGQVKSNKESMIAISQDNDMAEAIDKWIARKKFSKLLDLWVKGLELDWNKLYGDVKPRRISLPAYPFARERYWIDPVVTVLVRKKGTTASVLHPLLHTNTSNFSQQSYSSTFSGEEFFLDDHHIKGGKVLSAAACLEMARAAVEQVMLASHEASILELRNTVWARPIVVTENKQVTIALFEKGNDQVDYEIYSQDKEEEIVHCQGHAFFSRQPASAKLDLEQLKRQGGQESRELLTKIQLPVALKNTQSEFILHPSLIDSAFRASTGLQGGFFQYNNPSLPSALESVRIVFACTKEMFAWVRYHGNSVEGTIVKLDIDLCDQDGNVCVQIRGVSYQTESFKSIEQASDHATSSVTPRPPKQIFVAGQAAEKISVSADGQQALTEGATKKPTDISLGAPSAPTF